MSNLQFTLQPGHVADFFLKIGCNSYADACCYIAQLPYRRNADKSDVLCVIKDQAGTCSTKHALLRKLAIEQGREDIQLVLGLFKMDATYTNKIKHTLERYNLQYLPEAHNYLKVGSCYYDFTKPGASYMEFKSKLLEERIIEYHEVSDIKIALHKAFIAQWATENSTYSAEEIWAIREQCIMDLQV